MSFATEQKMDIIAQPIKNKCCKRALLFGVITSRGRSDGDPVSAVVDSRITADYVSGIVHDIYGKDGEVSTLPGGGRGYLISFRSKTAAEHLIRRIESRNGAHTVEAAEALGIGSVHYVLTELD